MAGNWRDRSAMASATVAPAAETVSSPFVCGRRGAGIWTFTDMRFSIPWGPLRWRVAANHRSDEIRLLEERFNEAPESPEGDHEAGGVGRGDPARPRFLVPLEG